MPASSGLLSMEIAKVSTRKGGSSFSRLAAAGLTMTFVWSQRIDRHCGMHPELRKVNDEAAAKPMVAITLYGKLRLSGRRSVIRSRWGRADRSRSDSGRQIGGGRTMGRVGPTGGFAVTLRHSTTDVCRV